MDEEAEEQSSSENPQSSKRRRKRGSRGRGRKNNQTPENNPENVREVIEGEVIEVKPLSFEEQMWEDARNSPRINISLQSEFKESIFEAMEELEKVNSITKKVKVKFFHPLQEVEREADPILGRGRRIEYKALGWVHVNPPEEENK
jgi:hypothetical protein